jgi:hypothetical protein
VIVASPIRAVLERLGREHPPLCDAIGHPVMGVKTGANSAFFVEPEIDWDREEAIVDGVPVPLSDLARVVRGRDLARWRAVDSLWMLRPRTRAPWVAALSAARRTASLPPLAYERREHRGWKVVWKDVSRGLVAAPLAPSREMGRTRVALVPNQTLYCVPVPAEAHAWIGAAVLNSIVAEASALAVADRAKDFHYRYFGRTVARIPVPALSPAERGRLASLARRAATDGEAREQIERILASAYRVTAAESALLDAFVRERLGR